MLRPGRRATIRDVARLAGVSHQTVSRYFRQDGGMRPVTRERIAAAVATLDYRPSLVARAMKDRRTRRLALVFPRGAAVSSLELINGAGDAAREAGYVVDVVTLGGPPDARHQRVLELADCGLFEGIVSLTPLPEVESRAESLATPTVTFGIFDAAMRSVGVLADATRVAELVEGLAARGHERFVHVAGDVRHTSARRRRAEYLDAVARLGLESVAVIEAGWDPDAARRGVVELPDGCGATAIVAANDTIATGAIRGAAERGWHVPGDVSVTGWDDSQVARVMLPSLTSVHVDHERLGRDAIRSLLLRMGVVPPDDGSAVPLTRVIWRESTGPAPARSTATSSASHGAA